LSTTFGVPLQVEYAEGRFSARRRTSRHMGLDD
jgi:hypothetical protein